MLARGDSGWYVMSRYLRRHRFTLAAGIALFLSLAGGLAGTAWQARVAAIQRDQAVDEAARSKAVNDYLMHMFRVADEDEGETVSARKVLEQAASRVREEFASDPRSGARNPARAR